jgi:hypothetical protein
MGNCSRLNGEWWEDPSPDGTRSPSHEVTRGRPKVYRSAGDILHRRAAGCFYSLRRARSGLIVLARRAGKRPATRATNASIIPAHAVVHTSVAGHRPSGHVSAGSCQGWLQRAADSKVLYRTAGCRRRSRPVPIDPRPVAGDAQPAGGERTTRLSISLQAQDASNDAGDAFPVLGLTRQLLQAALRDRVEASFPVVL